MRKIALLLGFILIALQSCKKDPCENTVCLNGGECLDGTCQCPAGFSGPDCSAENKCYNVTCFNNGICLNGTCDCADGYSGPTCLDQITPRKIFIKEVRVKNFPATDNGAGWDLTSGADLYLDIYQEPNGSAPLASFKNAYYENATPGVTYKFTFNGTGLELTNMDVRYGFVLMDNDTDADDQVGGLIGYIYSNTNGFPPTQNWVNGDFTFEIDMTYAW